MSDFDASRPGLPVPLMATGARPSLARSAPVAAFVSQLLAARERLPVQRPSHTDSLDAALGAYGRGASIAVRRLPKGYRTSLTA
jgi:hypothetical protein